MSVGAHRMRSALLPGFAVVLAIALGAFAPTPWTGIGFALTWSLFFFVGSSWLPALAPRQTASSERSLRSCVLATAAGLGTCLLLWSTSALTLKSFWPGTAVAGSAGVLGLVRFTRRAREHSAVASSPTVQAVVVLATLLGVYLEGLNELVWKGHAHYTFRSDWDAHLYWAALVREQGLPFVGPAGSPEVPFASLMHTGLLCLVVGIEQITQTTLYQAARIFAVGCFPLLALAGLSLLARFGLGAQWSVLAALSGLVWASPALPLEIWNANWKGVWDLYLARITDPLPASGSLYHNLTQLGSVAVAATALVALDECVGSRRDRHLALACFLVVVSGLIKPTTFVVLAPALCVVLVLARSRARRLLVAGCVLGAGVLFYGLPALVEELPPAPPWAWTPGRALTLDFWSRQWVSLGLALPAGLAWSWGAGHRLRSGSWDWTDVGFVALGGGVLFAGSLTEPSRTDAGNHLWSEMAAIILVAPCLVNCVARWANALAEPRWWPQRAGALLAVALLIAQLGGGLWYAFRYPRIRHARLNIAQIESLEQFRDATRPGTRMLIDISLVRRRAAGPYLARPSPIFPSLDPHEESDRDAWQRANRGEDGEVSDALLATRDAIVVGPHTAHLISRLQRTGWREVVADASGRHSLWVRDEPPVGASGSVGPTP